MKLLQGDLLKGIENKTVKRFRSYHSLFTYVHFLLTKKWLEIAIIHTKGLNKEKKNRESVIKMNV